MMGKLPFDTSRPEKLSKLQRATVRMVGAPDSNLAEKIAVMRKAVVPAGIPVRVITSGIAEPTGRGPYDFGRRLDLETGFRGTTFEEF